MNRRTAILAAASLLAACGGSTAAAGTGTVSGTVGSISFNHVADAAFATYSGAACPPNASNSISAFAVVLSSGTGLCSQEQVGSDPNGPMLGLAVAAEASGSTPPAAIGPGTYNLTISASQVNIGVLENVVNGSCASNSGYLAASGTITITSLTSSTAIGSYSVSFVDGNGNPAGTLSGTFNAPLCAVTQHCTSPNGCRRRLL